MCGGVGTLTPTPVQEKPKEKPKDKKSGQPLHNWSKTIADFGSVRRAVDDIGNAYGDKGREFDELDRLLKEAFDVLTKWQKKLTKTGGSNGQS
jgi:hypothetical protein